MKIALASPPIPKSIADGMYWAEKLIKEAADAGAEIICFPETFIPGYPLPGYDVEESSSQKVRDVLDEARALAAKYTIAVILPMDWYDTSGFLNIAHVISNSGKVLGYQTKNQLDPTEDFRWVPGTKRSIFEVNGLKFGVTICHEGFRYPESVRWAAQNGAHVVFHPHCAGSDMQGPILTEWGAKDNPYYEKAMMMRSIENTIYFASANYCFKFPDSASSVIAPNGTCIAYQAYGVPGIVVADIEPKLATGLLAKRFKNELYI